MVFDWKKLMGLRGRIIQDRDIDPDEIFLDSTNLPAFNTDQFEGRLEKPITARTLSLAGLCFLFVFLVFAYKAWNLQVKNGLAYYDQSQDNHLSNTVIFAKRGRILDRNGKELAWNSTLPDTEEYLGRQYLEAPGFAHVLGYVKFPSKDDSGFYYKDVYEGQDGVEKFYNTELAGENGLRIVEVNALGKIQSESVVRPPKDGADITLSIDSDLQAELYNDISSLAHRINFQGGAGVIMNAENGEILALTSFPEYSPQILSLGKDRDAIKRYLTDPSNAFLDRVVSGLYTPGSIIKPYIAVGALTENVISPDKKILSTGSISIPNAYDPKLSSVFTDWRAQGWVNIKDALSVSSDVYFYEVGGGYQDQKGIGIANIDKYTRLFGFGSVAGQGFFAGSKGTIPNPAWKEENFPGDPWRIGDTYHTAIGQYGFQVTPLQAVRAVASIGNGGHLLSPTLISGDKSNVSNNQTVPISDSTLQIVREGMRQGVLTGISKGLNIPSVEVASKTGTAELGTKKQFVNSWVTGFFPYEHPKYAFAILMEKGPSTNTVGALSVMRQLLDWMTLHTPDYLK
ncbi:MAG: penicillin-binding transpeptidase domain-containing protein [Candidatus Pacebacteria bacterium]|nr:penicillin-binding transpeptidase domain-containing protein [Candidatus Paceibacterota bacterium]